MHACARHKGPFLKAFCPYKSVANSVAFPIKRLGVSSVTLINTPFCGDTFSTDTR